MSAASPRVQISSERGGPGGNRATREFGGEVLPYEEKERGPAWEPALSFSVAPGRRLGLHGLDG